MIIKREQKNLYLIPFFFIFHLILLFLHHFKAYTTTNSELFELYKYLEWLPRHSTKKTNRKILKLRFLKKMAILKSSKSSKTLLKIGSFKDSLVLFFHKKCRILLKNSKKIHVPMIILNTFLHI